MSVGNHIRECLRRYMEGHISARDFQEWFHPRAWDIDRTGDHDTVNLVHDIELLLAEYTSGHWTEAEMHQKLREHPQLAGSSTSVITASVEVSSTNSGPAAEAGTLTFGAGQVFQKIRIEVQQAA